MCNNTQVGWGLEVVWSVGITWAWCRLLLKIHHSSSAFQLTNNKLNYCTTVFNNKILKSYFVNMCTGACTVTLRTEGNTAECRRIVLWVVLPARLSAGRDRGGITPLLVESSEWGTRAIVFHWRLFCLLYIYSCSHLTWQPYFNYYKNLYCILHYYFSNTTSN